MKDYQKRVLDEKAELDKKLESLKNFVTGVSFQNIPEDEQDRLISQHNIMNSYSLVLGMRIAAF